MLGTKAGGALQLAAAPLRVGSHGGLTLLSHTKKSLSVFFFLFIIASPPCRHLTAAVAQCAAGALVPVGPWQHHRHLGCGT